eukprot:4931148-Pyramimonas_sp.AAC.1
MLGGAPYEATKRGMGCDGMSVGDACGRWKWGRGIGVFGGVPYGATKRLRGVAKWVWLTRAG